jgi:hypothetical protein
MTQTVKLCTALGSNALKRQGNAGGRRIGRARCEVRTLMRTRRAEWERRSYVAEVFEPCLGVLGDFSRGTRSTLQ